MRILVFEDDEKDIAILRECCNSFFKKKQMDYKLDVSDDKSFLLKNISNYDILFLDIEINSLNGIDVGLELRKSNVDCRIIITSNYKEYLVDGYKINADRYFIKPIMQQDFNIEMEAVINAFFRKYASIYDKSIHNKKIYYNEILYIDSFERRTRLHLLNGKVLFANYPLKYWISNLDNSFFGQSHKSYLINFSFVSGFTKQDIILINNENIPISRLFKKSFNDLYLEYLHNYL